MSGSLPKWGKYRMYSLKEHKEHGQDKPTFSIVELLVVVVALAVVSAVLLPKMMCSNTRGKEIALRSDLKMLRGAIQAFYVDTGHYPCALRDLAETDVTQVRVSGGRKVPKADWYGPYIETVPNDPVCGGGFRYLQTTGKVSSATSGPALDGTEYCSW